MLIDQNGETGKNNVLVEFVSKCKSGNSVGSPEKCVTYTETCVCQKNKSVDFCSTIHWKAHALS